MGAGHAFECWASSDDVEEFRAHISCRYPPAIATPSRTISHPGGAGASWFACCGCWQGLASLCGRGVRSDQLYLFVTKARFRELVGGGASSDDQASEFFDRWRENVPVARRWGTDSEPSVSVAVDGVFLSR